jgi:predicted esterase
MSFMPRFALAFLSPALLMPMASPATQTISSPPAKIVADDPAKKRLDMMKAQPFAVKSIFDGDAFPKIDFHNRDLVQAAVGPYTLNVRFFDALWNEVTVPKENGRYGALVEVSAGEISFTRHFTLYRTPAATTPYDLKTKISPAFGLSEELIAQEQWNIADALGHELDYLAGQGDRQAKLLAALQDIQKDPVRWQGFEVSAIDGAWWAELRKRLGENQDYAHLIYKPDDYDKDQRRWPLILFLHGSGERGSNLDAVKDKGPLGYIHKHHPLPFIVVTPQCPSDEGWDPARLARLLDQVAAEYRVDPARIYVTGLSMGGFGTFDFAATYPDKVAAIAPLSGGESPEIAKRLTKIPTWIFHGAEDTTVATRYSVDIAQAMQRLGEPVKLTIYPGVAHGRWDVTYSNPDLYTWFLDHTR